jgi:hypothetical protein
MKYARIVNDIVVETTFKNPNKIFHPDLAKMFIECPDEVESRWTYDGETFTAPPEPVVEETIVEEPAAEETIVEEPVNTSDSDSSQTV